MVIDFAELENKVNKENLFHIHKGQYNLYDFVCAMLIYYGDDVKNIKMSNTTIQELKNGVIVFNGPLNDELKVFDNCESIAIQTLNYLYVIRLQYYPDHRSCDEYYKAICWFRVEMKKV